MLVHGSENRSDFFTIRPALPADAKPFRMILPEVHDASVRLVAESTADGRIVAAAAMTASMRPKSPTGPGVAVHVIPPWRQRGIGKTMFANLIEVASKAKAEAVFAIQKVEAGTEAEDGCRWLGLSPLETVVYHELPLAAIEARLTPLYEWMRDREGIPANAEIVALCDADREAVADLHVSCLGGGRETLLAKMRGEGLGAYHPRYSRVLLVDGTVKGCILAHRESKEVAVVDANILAPDVRGGWANVWLKLEATRGATQLGIERFVYSTFDHYADTRAFTQLLGGVETRKMLLMHRLIAPTGDDASE